MPFHWFIIAVLGVWRVTHLLVAEDGPWNAVTHLRARAGRGFWGQLLDCFHCLSLWIALLCAYALGATWTERAMLWPALSGAAVLIEMQTKDSVPPAQYCEDPPAEETADVVLRK